MDVQYFIKFTRCPKCQSYSLQAVPESRSNRTPGLFSKKLVECTNCDNHYVLQGDSLKEINSSPTETITAPPLIVPTSKKIPEKKFPLKTTLAFVLIIILLAAGVFFLIVSQNHEHGNLQSSIPKIEKKQISLPEVTEIEKTETDEKTEQSEESTSDSISLEESAENNKTPITEETVIQEKKVRAEDTQTDKSSQSQEISEPDEGTPVIAALESLPEEETSEKVLTEPSEMEPTVYKIFDYAGLKVRSSSPDSSDFSQRWYFSHKQITIKRSDTQKVVLAGDPSGKHKWAVDDEILINGERIKGCSDQILSQGYIPESNQMPPVDITHLVPSDHNAQLEIKLVDYGIYWGNTSLYIVVI